MHIKDHTNDLLDLIKYAQRDKTTELEVIVKEQFEKTVSNEMFNNVLSRLKGTRNIKLVTKQESLDISFKDDFDNIRVSVLGQENITNYCQTNDIKSIDKNYVSYQRKTPIRYVSIYDYNLKFNLKREIELSNKDGEVLDLNRNWTKLGKFFRYKKRMTFRSDDNLFNIDLTVIKTSNNKTIRLDNKIYKRKDVKDYMKKYIVKPPYVADLDDWFSKLKPEDDVELIGKKRDVMISSKTLQKSNVFDNPQSYEIELEYIGNKTKNKLQNKEILVKMLQHTINILQAVQKSYYLISETEKKMVIENYKMMMGDYKFKGPQNVTLELKHVVEREYSEYEEANTIRKGYSVTDKADGERNLMIIVEDGSIYLMSRKNVIKSVGAKCTPLANSIFDCEYIVKDKEGKNINYLMIFDLYFKNNMDLRERILNRSQQEKLEGKIEESRFEVLDDCMEIFDKSLVKEKNNNLEISKKKFYYGDDDAYNEQIDDLVTQSYSVLKTLEKGSDQYNQYMEQIKSYKMDTKIFDEAKKVYQKEYPYKIDGLIFTPRKLKVGEMPGTQQKNMFDGRWYKCFKWKPPEENTIDFLVKYKKDPENEKNDLITYKTIGGKVVEIKTLVLYVGYNPEIHTRYNSCRVLNENLTFESTYAPAIFQPFQPFVKDIHNAHIPTNNGNLYCSDKNIILENNIVEFSYDPNDPEFCWKPLRVRDTLKPNDFITATNVWGSIHNPVTEKMITTGDVEGNDNVYYTLNIKRSERKSKSLNDFHSYVKKSIITKNISGENNVLDLGVGKGGDLNHMIDGKVNILVGIDSIFDNLSNVENGMCNRILSRSLDKDVNLLSNTMVVWADVQKNILDNTAGNDDLNKYYLDVIYGNITLDKINNAKLRQFYNLGNVSSGFGFDLVSCQFAMHYFFKNTTTLDNFLNNVSKSLKSGGRFIGTCFDGKKVFEKLQYVDTIGTPKLWTIKKLYDKLEILDNDTSLGYEIEVFNESIGATIKEYIVNFDFLVQKVKNYNMEIVELRNFSEIFGEIDKKSYGQAKKMSEELKEYSFLNNAFVFEKK